MDAGSLDARVTIETRTATQDADTGRDIVTWTTLATVWAEVRDVLPSRDERVRQGLEVASRQTRIRIRYRTDVDSSMRVTVHRDGDTIYQIVGGPAVLGHKEGIELLCERDTVGA